MTEKEFRDLWDNSTASNAMLALEKAGLVFDPEPPAARVPPKDLGLALSEGARLQQERDTMIQRQFYQKLLVETAREMFVREVALGGLEDCVAAAEALLRLCGLEEPGRTAQEPES